MGKLWQKTQDSEGQSKLVEVDGATLRITEPSVVFLSGFLTLDNKPKAIAGSIKNIQELAKSYPGMAEAPPVYCWSHSGVKNIFNLASYNSNPSERSSDAGFDIGAAVLMPLVTSGFARGTDGAVSGTPLPLDKAKQNLRNVTFFGYSAGGIVAQETYNATLKMMKDVGYAEKDAREALKEVVLIATGVFSRYRKEKDRFTTAYLVATNDRMMRAKNWIWGTVGTLLRTAFTTYGRKKKPMSIMPLSDTSVLISAPVRSSLYEVKQDENGVEYKKPITPLYPKMLLRRSYHELPHYLTQNEENNPFANIALFSLVNALQRRERLAPLALISAPAKAPSAEEYSQKIAKALKPMKG